MSTLVVVEREAREVPGRLVDGRPMIPAGALEELLGWQAKPEGLCRGEICVPFRDRAALYPGGRRVSGDGRGGSEDELDLSVAAGLLGRPVVVDEAAGMVAVGLDAEQRRRALVDLEAPDFSLPDLDGRPHRLGEWAGRKRLLITFASWCGCRYDLPGWQALQDELSPDALTVVAVAMDNEAVDVRPWVDGITLPVLLDANHLLSELYAMSNVPTVVWIAEDGRIARPNALAFGTDTFRELTGVAAGPHLDEVRRWVREDRAPMAAADASGAVADLTEEEVLARLHFRIGAVALGRGDQATARRHLAVASSLAPYDWTVRRAAMPLVGDDPFGQGFLDLYAEWQRAGSPYHGLPVATDQD
ncbi:MAG TPA: TlpA disulfide reductase family protein [Acidimicrobiales bacterium]|jgi:peroxiredoxin|nr:TlpA disulfide reductase family protein [Acidimicrobiales bacterium]